MSNKYIDAAEIRRAITTIKDPGELFEIRAIGSGRPKVLSGYFTDADKAIHELERLNLSGRNVFITLNKIDEACYSREQRDVFLDGRTTTSDDDIVAYKWMLLDLDPVRRSGVSSSDAELSEAEDLARNVVKYGRELGLPEPVVSMSGNGYHVKYKTDLPNTVETRQLMERTLKALDLMYSTDTVKVDTSVFNPSRISKLYGTVAQKGASSDERPHRMSRIVQVPDHIEPVPVELLKEIAAVYPEQDKARRDTKATETTRFDVYDLLNKNGVRYTERTGNGYTKLILDECIFDSSHKAPDAMITISDSGALGYKCLHNSCSCYKWQDARLKLDPTAYDTPAPTRTREVSNETNRRDSKAMSTVRDGVIVPMTRPDALTLTTARELHEMNIPPIEWRLKDVFPAGAVNMLSAKPKMFKSYLGLGVCLAVCEGSDYLGFKSVKCECLYFDLESSKRRPKARIEQILGDKEPPEGLYIVTLDQHVCKIGDGFEQQLTDILDQHKDIGLVVIDVFKKIRKNKRASDDSYDRDYADIEPLTRIASERNISILLISHHTKGVHEDAFDDAVGSSGIMGALDVAWSIKAKRSDNSAVLHITGRDIESQEIEMTFNRDTFKWERLGTPEEMQAQRQHYEYTNSNIVRSIKQALSEGRGHYEGSASDIRQYGLYHNLPIWEDARRIGSIIQEYYPLLEREGISCTFKRDSKGRKYIFDVIDDMDVIDVTDDMMSQMSIDDVS